MSRLTNDLRERMARCVLDNAFSAQEKEANQNLRLAGDKIYDDIYGAHQKAMKSLPENWLKTSEYIRIAIAGQTHDVFFTDSHLIGHEHYWSKPKLYAGDEQVCVNFLKALDVTEDIKRQRKAMGREVDAILHSVQTFKKLWEVWPASKSLLEKFVSKPTMGMLPAIQFDKVNAALGLPVGAAIVGGVE